MPRLSGKRSYGLPSEFLPEVKFVLAILGNGLRMNAEARTANAGHVDRSLTKGP